ncbi:hypothetical protein BDV25DRAFT_144151 [Aspergillus avenaceus]|uniref:Uncharacterized protein n=1 Tax=Aspergillus avenaceus TaxID=36643 RepID=A0A5N6TI84_ASPAV|nr:hypothetical protein BDV25DRAFT_144151 [Aspergillus avenaceus]
MAGDGFIPAGRCQAHCVGNIIQARWIGCDGAMSVIAILGVWGHGVQMGRTRTRSSSFVDTARTLISYEYDMRFKDLIAQGLDGSRQFLPLASHLSHAKKGGLV